MTKQFNPDWGCQPDCVARAALKEHLRESRIIQDQLVHALEIVRSRTNIIPDNLDTLLIIEAALLSAKAGA